MKLSKSSVPEFPSTGSGGYSCQVCGPLIRDGVVFRALRDVVCVTVRVEFKNLKAEDPLWDLAFDVLKQLRPELTRAGLASVLESAGAQPPTFTALVVGGNVRAVAGWRVIANVNVGRKLYVDDLAVDESLRSSGYGKQMLAHLTEIAQELKCSVIDLDSGVQRFDAHRFYLRERFHISSHHFVKTL